MRDAVLTMIEEWAPHLRHEPAYANAYHQFPTRGDKFSEAISAVAIWRARRRPRFRGDVERAARPAETSDWRVRDDISAEDKAAIAAALAETEAEDARCREGAPQWPRPVNAPHLSAMPPNASAEDGDLQRAIRESERMADEARRSTPPHQPSPSAVEVVGEEVEKLKGDIAIASNSLKVFSQVLDGCIALRPPTPSTLANELVEQCRAMQPVFGRTHLTAHATRSSPFSGHQTERRVDGRNRAIRSLGSSGFRRRRGASAHRAALERRAETHD